MSGYSNWAWYAVLAMFGAALGVIAACIFLMIYYGMEYTEYVPDSVRIKTAAISTMFIIAATIVIYFRSEVVAFLSGIFGDKE